MARRYTILLLIPHLGGGGAERVIANLARSLPDSRFAVHLGVITASRFSNDTFPPHVQLHQLKAGRILFGSAALVRLVRKIQPDLILPGMFHLNFLVLLLKPLFPRATRILVRQNGDLSAWPRHSPRIGRLLYRLLYPCADGVISQSKAMAEELQQCLASENRIHVLPNPVDVDGIRQNSTPVTKWKGSGPHLLAIGRLSPEKGFDLLLDAFAIVRLKRPSADLVILGDGAERTALEARSTALRLGSSARFAGYAADPFTWFAGATLLVTPSRRDALPNVLLEAAAAGLPIVATPCSARVTELIQGQPGTWLAREISSTSLAQSIETALTALNPGARFAHPWIAPFRSQEAAGAYERLILETLAAGAP